MRKRDRDFRKFCILWLWVFNIRTDKARWINRWLANLTYFQPSKNLSSSELSCMMVSMRRKLSHIQKSILSLTIVIQKQMKRRQKSLQKYLKREKTTKRNNLLTLILENKPKKLLSLKTWNLNTAFKQTPWTPNQVSLTKRSQISK